MISDSISLLRYPYIYIAIEYLNNESSVLSVAFIVVLVPIGCLLATQQRSEAPAGHIFFYKKVKYILEVMSAVNTQSSSIAPQVPQLTCLSRSHVRLPLTRSLSMCDTRGAVGRTSTTSRISAWASSSPQSPTTTSSIWSWTETTRAWSV